MVRSGYNAFLHYFEKKGKIFRASVALLAFILLSAFASLQCCELRSASVLSQKLQWLVIDVYRHGWLSRLSMCQKRFKPAFCFRNIIWFHAFS